MVFINEVLEQNRRQMALDKAQCQAPGNMPFKQLDNSSIASRFVFDLDVGQKLLRDRLQGQAEVVDQLVEALAFIKADFADNNRPLWNALLVGPTGVGKTESAKLMAKILTGSAENLCRIDMNTLSQSHYSAAITGAPPGYVGSKEGVSLFSEALIKGDLARPGVVLFDEIEKASDEVLMALLSVLEDGYLTLTGSGKEISFRNSVVLMTTNLGAKYWQEERWLPWRRLFGFYKKRQQRVLNHLTRFFAPEFFNRIDRVVLFDALSERAAKAIFSLEVDQLNDRLSKKGWRLTLSLEACDCLVAEGFSTRYGARSVRRLVRDKLEMPLARFLVEHAQLRSQPNQPVSASTPPPGDLGCVHGVWRQGTVEFTC